MIVWIEQGACAQTLASIGFVLALSLSLPRADFPRIKAISVSQIDTFYCPQSRRKKSELNTRPIISFSFPPCFSLLRPSSPFPSVFFFFFCFFFIQRQTSFCTLSLAGLRSFVFSCISCSFTSLHSRSFIALRTRFLPVNCQTLPRHERHRQSRSSLQIIGLRTSFVCLFLAIATSLKHSY